MSNTIINWRFWHWHLQVIRWSDWGMYLRDGRSPVTLMANDWHRGRGSLRFPSGGPGCRKPQWKRIEIYDGGWYLVGLALIVAALVWWAV